MSELRLAFPASAVVGKQRLTADDIALLRTYTFPQGIRTNEDVIVLLALHQSCPQTCDEWTAFFVEAMTAFIVDHTYPQGSLDDINAAWLIRTFATDGLANSALELELILNVMDISTHVPPELRVFALNQLHFALSREKGAYHLLRPIARKGITRHDLDYVNRVLRRTADDSRADLSTGETEAILEIDRQTHPAASHPHWPELVSAVGSYRGGNPAPSYASRWLRVTNDVLLSESA